MSHRLDSYFYELIKEDTTGALIRRDKVLFDQTSPYQHVEIFENAELGRVMILDGCVMITQRDEFTYHEMLVHPALLAHPNPENVLVVGGGDGGTLREVTKHPSVKRAVLCEIDDLVISSSREFLPFTACGLDHPKSEVFVGDGIEYIRQHKNEFDVVIVDSTDPVGFAEGLFRIPFYKDVLAAMRPGGIFVQQTESPFFDVKVWERIFVELKQVFTLVHPYGAAIPMYPSGYWTFAMASLTQTPKAHFDPKRVGALGELKSYSVQTQDAAFVLPAFAAKLIKG
jgi:spermidine synthase